MFKDRAGTFRTDFLGGLGSFDFLAEFGYGVLDNAMVGTAGTVIRTERTRIRRENSLGYTILMRPRKNLPLFAC